MHDRLWEFIDITSKREILTEPAEGHEDFRESRIKFFEIAEPALKIFNLTESELVHLNPIIEIVLYHTAVFPVRLYDIIDSLADLQRPNLCRANIVEHFVPLLLPDHRSVYELLLWAVSKDYSDVVEKVLPFVDETRIPIEQRYEKKSVFEWAAQLEKLNVLEKLCLVYYKSKDGQQLTIEERKYFMGYPTISKEESAEMEQFFHSLNLSKPSFERIKEKLAHIQEVIKNARWILQLSATPTFFSKLANEDLIKISSLMGKSKDRIEDDRESYDLAYENFSAKP